MKVSSLFDLITDSRDLVQFFDGVDSKEQLVSRLERLKRMDVEDLYACIEGLRATITKTLDDTLEMTAVLDEEEPDTLPDEAFPDTSALDRELEELGKEVGMSDGSDDETSSPSAESDAKNQNSESDSIAADPNIPVTPSS